MSAAEFLQIDFPALSTAILAALTCAVLGNFLVLRRQSLMGDAISHAVLPGIVVGFIIAGSRATLPMMGGAVVAALISGVLIELVRRFGRIETGASMGVVFTVMFALGVVLLEQAAAHSVDLDADCVLYGQLEDVLWFEASGWSSLLDLAALSSLPRELTTLVVLALATFVLLGLFYKELKITTFDAELASSLGIPSQVFHYGLILFVSLAAIASFEAVGSILVIAMLICPAATARLITDRFGMQILLSGAFGVASAVAGYVAAGFVPGWLGAGWALSASGMMAVMSGVFFGIALIAAPRHGILATRVFRAARSPQPRMA